MKVTVKYFGALAEQTGTMEEVVDLAQIGMELADLKSHCIRKYGLKDDGSMQIAINQQLGLQRSLENGDEIAFLPPFAGG
ncbi:MoaD/ThiS family protein [Marinoscillum sp.]|uniref:MoaD/ThiS family protein n=1 Tax=Marinoscillum sp. TaxID=2024838 RepID=UPI003BABC28D